MKKLGFITIGQAPRRDIMKDIEPIFGEGVELLQRGALDDLSGGDLQALAPKAGETMLVSCLRDGTSVTIAEERVIPLLQACIDDLEAAGAACIMFLCTGDFKDSLTATVPLLYPNKLLTALLPILCEDGTLTVLVPDKEQAEDVMNQWQGTGMQVHVLPISPYDSSIEDFEKTAELIKGQQSSCVLLDCMGYSLEMKRVVEQISGKLVLLPRNLTAAIAKAIVS